MNDFCSSFANQLEQKIHAWRIYEVSNSDVDGVYSIVKLSQYIIQSIRKYHQAAIKLKLVLNITIGCFHNCVNVDLLAHSKSNVPLRNATDELVKFIKLVILNPIFATV